MECVLCILLQISMFGMKRDCGGVVGILGGFRVVVKQVGIKSKKKINIKSIIYNNFYLFIFFQGFIENFYVVFCMVENVVGFYVIRFDDIIILYLGK